MSLRFRIGSALKYYARARRLDRIDHGAIRHLLSTSLDESAYYYDFDEIEGWRAAYLADDTEIQRHDLGAGSRRVHRRICDIARSSLSHPAQCRLLYRLIRAYQPRSILELGSSLGISTAYISKAAPEARCISIEGDPQIAAYARSTLSHLRNGAETEIRTGSFSEVLPQLWNDDYRPDLIFLDGHHTYDATITYFQDILAHSASRSLWLLDDIYWSPGMYRAWNELMGHPSVTASVDLYNHGWLLIDEDLNRAGHYTVRQPISKIL